MRAVVAATLSSNFRVMSARTLRFDGPADVSMSGIKGGVGVVRFSGKWLVCVGFIRVSIVFSLVLGVKIGKWLVCISIVFSLVLGFKICCRFLR